MKIIVNPHSLELQKTIDVNSGEYNIQNVEFDFSSEYEGLTKMAIFSNEDNSFQTMINDGSCIIPSEILQTDGTIGVGVYGYSVDGDKLIKRYSPKPVFFNVELGSYQLAEESVDPSSDIITQILAQLESQGEDIIALENNLDNLEDNVIPTLATKEEIPDVSGFITKDVNDLTNYTLTSDLSSVALSGNYSDLSGTPDLSVYSIITETGSKIDLEINSSTYVLTAKLYDKNNTLISTSTGIDLPLETMVIGASYDSATKEIVLTLKDGTTVRFSVADLVSGLQTEITSSNKLSADLVDDTSTTNKFVSSSDITNWNNKQNALTFDTTPTNGSTNPVTSGGIYTYINTIVGDIATALDNINGEVL